MTMLKDALDFTQNGRYDEALNAYESILQTQADSDEVIAVLGHRGWLLHCLKNYELAAEDYQRLIELQPENTDAKGLLAENLMLSGNVKQSLATALEVLNADGENIKALGVMARCHHRLTGAVAGSQDVIQQPSRVAINAQPNNVVLSIIEQDAQDRYTSVCPEIGNYIYSLVRFLKPRIAVETGTFIGYSSLCIGQAMKDNKQGHLHSFDLFMEVPGYVSPVNPEHDEMFDMVRNHAREAELEDWITYHKGDSSKAIKRLFGSNQNLTVDFAFIDGDHSIKGCLKDLQAVDQRLVEGGIILFHDTNTGFCNWYGPRYIMEQLKNFESADYEVLNLPTPDNTGLGMLRKSSSASMKHWKPTISELFRDFLFIHTRWKDKNR